MTTKQKEPKQKESSARSTHDSNGHADEQSDNNANNIRIIKKYPNRRVYDTHQSQYIKMDDLREMVIANIAFQVIDTQNKQDVTRSVLLQIILEQESEINPLFTSDNLRNFIRYSDNKNNQFFSQYLNQSLDFFQQQQEQFSKNMTDMFSSSPMEMFSTFTQSNADMWSQMQDAFMQQFQSTDSSDKEKNKD